MGLATAASLLLEVGRELVGALGLCEVPVGHGLLRGVQERAVQPLLAGGHVGLRGGTGKGKRREINVSYGSRLGG